ncbi:hypothetical protein H310_14346 [Aphanomyces invadans]|uniref:Uncharacterized protein n=2 Tax=Aphanomyces invadans TaxID=157072 RepID=A0A024TBH6_9STRA|nr:hypothetical protein H310_14346 [Aphanomyces invadans]ETV90931.1 hypothetical protein H310_14346 [Aphanomyces invadans]|eukprot:XP_008880413.1 hypothetical protein H310_14346 [Aphanomyces invadans]
MDLALQLNPLPTAMDRPSYYDRNRDQVRESQRLYRETNRDKIRAIHKAYYAKNRAKITAYKRERWHQMKAACAAAKSSHTTHELCHTNDRWATDDGGFASKSATPKMQITFLLNA